MADEPTDSGEEIILPKGTLEEIEKKKQHAILIEEIKRDLKTDPRYREFYSDYNPASIEHFIDQYARKKARYLQEGRNYIGYQENDLLRFHEEGEECLEQILQKKLFDKECLWRAERITIPGVEHSSDFLYWFHRIDRCPFLSPITREEVDLYIGYVLGDLYEEYPETEWRELRGEAESEFEDSEGIEYPRFFTIFDMHFGTGQLVKLPDIRGPKEDFYLELSHAEEWKKQKEKEENSPPPPQETRPWVNYYDLNVIEKFIKQFEDAKLLRYFHVVEEVDGPYMDDDLNEAIDMLRSAGEAVPIEAANNWRDAVIKAWEVYHRKKLADGIRAAYQDYLVKLENRVVAHDDEAKDTWDILRKHQKAEVIRGRVLNGEPPDFNF